MERLSPRRMFHDYDGYHPPPPPPPPPLPHHAPIAGGGGLFPAGFEHGLPPHRLHEPHFGDRYPPCFAGRFRGGDVGGGGGQPGLALAVLAVALLALFIQRRAENRRRRRRAGIWLLDCARQLVAQALACAAVTGFVGASSAPDRLAAGLSCRLPTVAGLMECVVGLPLVWGLHLGTYAILGKLGSHFGMRSGVYSGSAGVFIVFIAQTLVLAVCLAAAQSVAWTIVFTWLDLDRLVVYILLSRTWMLGPGAEVVMSGFLYPLLFSATQLLVVDRIVRAHATESGYNKSSEVGYDSEMSDAELEASDEPELIVQRPHICLESVVIDSSELHLGAFLEPNRSSSSSSAESSPARFLPISLRTAENRPQIFNEVTAAPASIHSSSTSDSSPMVMPPGYLADDDPAPDEELPTYDVSQRQALQNRERERQRIMDMKSQHLE